MLGPVLVIEIPHQRATAHIEAPYQCLSSFLLAIFICIGQCICMHMCSPNISTSRRKQSTNSPKLQYLDIFDILAIYTCCFLAAVKLDCKFYKSNVFLQRLYRTVISQTLISPQETAQKMVQIMKERQFTRIFQKNHIIDKV